MKNIYSFFPLVLIFLATELSAQNITSKKWNDLFSYNNILAIKEDGDRIISATENGIFFYKPNTGEITKLSKANGLHQVKISAFDYNATTKMGLVGYNDGSLDVITPNEIFYIVDIPFATGYTGDKKINHISINGDQAVISAGYGISIFDLIRREFGKTTYFTNSVGIFEASNEAVIKEGKVYSATNSGLKTHEISNTTFPVYSNWTTIMPGLFTQVEYGNDIIFSNTTTAYLYNGTSTTALPQGFTGIADIEYSSGNYTITDDSRIYVLDNSGLPINSTTFGEITNTANVIEGRIYGGTKFSGLKDQELISYKPDGPYFNVAYKISLFGSNQLLVSTGGRDKRYNNPIINPNNPGFYYFNGNEWIYSSYFKDANFQLNVLDVVANPLDNSEMYFTNYVSNDKKGIYKMKYNSTTKDIEFVNFYNLDFVSSTLRRPVGLAYDDKGSLFGTIAYFDETGGGNSVGLAVYDKSIDNFSLKKFAIESSAIQKALIQGDKLWISLPRTNNFLIYDYKNSPLVFSDDNQYIIGTSNGLPSNGNGVISSAFDKSGDLWIGANQGLRILPNAMNNYENDPTVEPIIIEQSGLGEELFRNSEILQIEVDEGNHKWVSVDGGGVYYLSPDGQRVIKHFTKENSPLPTNSVTDIKVDKKTGKVYLVTYEGIVTYQGDVGEVGSGFGNVLVYPNPVVYSNFKGVVTIKGLAEKTNIRIADAAGNLVHQAVARGGFYEWDLNNMRGKRVASGVYFVLMTNEDGSDKATAKIAVVN